MRSRVVYTPRERKKYKKPSRINWKLLFYIAFVLVFAGGFLYIARLPRLQINKISIAGNQTLDSGIIQASIQSMLEGNYAFILPKRFVLLASGKTIAERLKGEFPLIENLSAAITYPDALRVDISERKLFAILCNDLEKENPENIPGNTASTSIAEDNTGGKNNTVFAEIQCAYVDKNGFAYDSAPHSSGTIIVRIETDHPSLSIPGQIIDSELIKKMQYIGEHLPPASGERVNSFELPSEIPSEYRVKTQSGFRLFLKKDSDPEKMLVILKTVLESEVKERRARLEYMDLRFGNKVFFKVK